jgi:dipeptidyl aminopeptidase/acylaminoacyl peptidase
VREISATKLLGQRQEGEALLGNWFRAGPGLLVVFLVGALPSNDQWPTALAIEDAINTHSFAETSRLAVSPDGAWVAYVIRDNARPRTEPRNYEDLRVSRGVYAGDLGAEIWISNTKSGETRNLTEGKGTSWDPSWSPDGKLLAFFSDWGSDGQSRVWVWDRRTDTLRSLSSVVVRADSVVNRMEWTADSHRLVVTALPEGMTAEEYSRHILAPPLVKGSAGAPGSSVAVYEAGPSLSGRDGPDPAMSNLDASSLRDLALVDISSDRTTVIVHGRRIGAYALSPDGSRIAFITPTKFDRPGSWQRISDLSIASLETRKTQTLVSGARLDGGLSWSPDGSSIAYRACEGADGGCDFHVVTSAGGPTRRLSHLEPVPFDGWAKTPLWGADGKYIYFVQDGALWRDSVREGVATKFPTIPGREIRYLVSRIPGRLWTSDGDSTAVVLAHDGEQKQDGFFAIDLSTGKSQRLLERGECYTCKWPAPVQGQFLASACDTLAGTKEIAYVAEDSEHAPDLWVSDARFRKPRRVTHLNPQFDRYEAGQARLIEWLSDDGNRLQGAVLLPPGYVRGRRYPLVVWVYLGAHLSDAFDAFGFGEYPGPFNFQLLATRGYAVLLPDCEKARGDPGGALSKSILPGVSRLVELGIADPQRIGIMGHSLGGFSTLALLIRTSRFQAAMEADSFSDFAALHGTIGKDGTGFQYSSAERLLASAPWQDPATYVQNSPYYRLDRVTTPLLIVHGSEDRETAVFLARQTFAGLRRLNKQVEYAEYGGEGHVPRDWNAANQIDLARRIIAWMDRYLREDRETSKESAGAP